MCDIEIPRPCKRPVFDSALLESSAKAAAPSLDTMKRNINRINSRLDEIKNDPSFKRTPIPMGLMREYQQLLKKKENFLYDLKSHPDYESFVLEMKKKRGEKKSKNFQQLSEKEQEEFLSGMRQRSKPKRVRLLDALAKVNYAVNNIKEDKFFCKNPFTKKSLKKLILHRNKICRKLMKYPARESKSFECFRFKPCKLKFVKASQYEPKKKRGEKSRFLKFHYDDDLNRIGTPRYRTICDIIEKYQNMISALKFQIIFTEIKKEDDEELRSQKCSKRKQLKRSLKECSQRRKFLIELKKLIDENRVEKIKEKRAREEMEKSTEKTDEKKKFEIPPGYWNADQVKLFSRDLQVPRKHKLVEILRRQKILLKKIEKIEKIEAGPKGLDENKEERDKTVEPSASQKSVNKKATFENVESAENKEKTKNILLVRNKTDVRSLKAGIESNIKFIQEFLNSYPEPKLTLHSCTPVTENEEQKKFDFEEKNDALNDFAMPRPRTLREVLKMYEEMLKNFEADVSNEKALNELKNGNDLTDSKGSSQKNKRKRQTKKYKKITTDEPTDSLVPPGFRDDETNQSQPQTNEKIEEESQQVDSSNKKTNEKPETNKEADSSGKKLKCQAHGQSRFVITCKQKKNMDLQKRQKMYKKLQNAKTKIEELIKAHEERIEKWNSHGTSGIRYYVHNKNCQKVAAKKKSYEVYKMKGAYKKLSSRAKKSHMRYALRRLNENIKASLKIKYGEKKEIEEILNALKEGKDCLLSQQIESKREEEKIVADVKKKTNSKKAEKDANSKDQTDGDDTSVPDGTPKLTPYLCRYLRRKINLEKSLKEIKNETSETVHDQSHKNTDALYFPPPKQYFDFSKKREQNLEHTDKLAKPKTYVLQGTLNEFSKFMSHDKREGIKCTLNARMPQMMRPEDLEAQVRKTPKLKEKKKIQNQACKLKNRLSKQIYGQLARILKKKIAEKMALSRKGIAVTEPIREVEKTIYMFLMEVNGAPRSNLECEMYKKFTSVISEFLLSALQEKVEKKLETEKSENETVKVEK